MISKHTGRAPSHWNCSCHNSAQYNAIRDKLAVICKGSSNAFTISTSRDPTVTGLMCCLHLLISPCYLAGKANGLRCFHIITLSLIALCCGQLFSFAFCFLLSGDITIPNRTSDSSAHLNFADIAHHLPGLMQDLKRVVVAASQWHTHLINHDPAALVCPNIWREKISLDLKSLWYCSEH